MKEVVKKIKQYEPKMHKAVTSVFHNSYEYTKEYERFKKRMQQRGESCE